MASAEIALVYGLNVWLGFTRLGFVLIQMLMKH